MKKTWFTKCLLAIVAAVCFVFGFITLQDSPSITVTQADAGVKTVDEIDLKMEQGAAVRISVDGHTGLKFQMSLSAVDYLGLQNNVGDNAAYQEVTYGMLIMPYAYLDKYGDFTVENVFGNSAKYDWAVFENGNWVYSGDNSTKKRIINITSTEMVEDGGVYYHNGSFTDILDENLIKDFVGRGYIKYLEQGAATYSYVLADYYEGNVQNSCRSIMEVAEKAIASGDYVGQDTVVQNLNSLYINKINDRTVKFYNGDTLIHTATGIKGMVFDGNYGLEDFDDYIFSRWVDEEGNTVEENPDYAVTKMTKLYAVYTKGGLDYYDSYLGEEGLVRTALNNFLSMQINESNLASAEALWNELQAYFDVLTKNEYVAVVSQEIEEKINAKIDEMNALKASNPNDFEQYSGTITDYSLKTYGAKAMSGSAGAYMDATRSDVFTDGQIVFDFSALGTFWAVSLPMVNYSLYEEVSLDYSSVGGALSIGLVNENDVANKIFGYSNGGSIAGKIIIRNQGNKTLNVVLLDTSNGKNYRTATITDENIFYGKKSVEVYIAQHANDRNFIISEMRGKAIKSAFVNVDYSFEYVTDFKNSFDGASATSGSAIAAALYNESTFASGGIDFDFSASGVFWNINLPKINYTQYTDVIFYYATKSPSSCLSIGLVEENDTANKIFGNSGGSAIYGKIELVYTGTSLQVTLTDVSSGNNVRTIEITDADIINGNKSALVSIAQHTNYNYFVLSNAICKKTYAAQTVSVSDFPRGSMGSAALNGAACWYGSTDNQGITVCRNDDGYDGGIYYETGNVSTVWTVALPRVNYSLYKEVKLDWKATNSYVGFGFNSGNYFNQSDGIMAGTLTILNNFDGTLTALMKESNVYGSVKTVTITDANVINGTESLCLYLETGSLYRQIVISQMYATAISEGAFSGTTTEAWTGVDGEIRTDAPIVHAEETITPDVLLAPKSNDYILAQIYDFSIDFHGAAIESAKNDASVEYGTSTFNNGLRYSCVDANVAYTVYLPKVNYAQHKAVYFDYSTVNAWSIIGLTANPGAFGDAGEILIGKIICEYNEASGALGVTLTLTRASGFALTKIVTDQEIINGEKPLDIYFTSQANGRALDISVPKYVNVVTLTFEDIGATIDGVASSLTGVTTTSANGWVRTGLTNIGQASTSITYGLNAASGVFKINLPKVDYTQYTTVVFNCYTVELTYLNVDHSSLGNYSNGGDVQIVVTNENGVVTLTLNYGSFTNSKVIDDMDILNGNKSAFVYATMATQWERYFVLNSITMHQEKTPSLGYGNEVIDYSQASYEVFAVDLEEESLLEIETSSNSITVKTNSEDVKIKNYVIYLPWVDFSVNPSLEMQISTNNGEKIGLTPEMNVGLRSYNAEYDYYYYEKATLSLNYYGNIIYVKLAVGSNVDTLEITDSDIINGKKGLAIYVEGGLKTRYTLSNAMGATIKQDVVPEEEFQELDIAANSGSSEYAAYRIVYDSTLYEEAFAADELQKFLSEITGKTYLTVAVEDVGVIKDDSRYIVLGEKFASNKGLTTFDLTQTNGFNILQNYTNLYIYGESEMATLKGVYGFMNTFADLTFFTDDVYTYTTKDSIVVDAGYASATNYSFDTVLGGYSEQNASIEYTYRLGLEQYEGGIRGLGVSQNIHCWTAVFGNGSGEGGAWTQADYNNFKASSANKATALEAFKKAIYEYPNYDVYCLAPTDAEYGPNNSVYLELINYCAEGVDLWLQQTNPSRKVSLCMLAYRATYIAPTSGNFYEGVNASAAVVFAPVGARHSLSYADTHNKHKDTTTLAFDSKTVETRLNEWAKLTDNIYFWFYATDFNSYMMPFDCIDAMQANYQLAASINSDWIFYQGQYQGSQSGVGTDWQRLKTYLSSELAKDVNCDLAQKQENFMNAYFGPAASIMTQLLESEQTYLKEDLWGDYISQTRTQHYKYYGIINSSAIFCEKSSEYFPVNTLKNWMGYINRAKTAVETAYSNGEISLEEKNAYIERITIESLSFRYLLVSNHGDNEYDSSLDAIVAVCREYGLNGF